MKTFCLTWLALAVVAIVAHECGHWKVAIWMTDTLALSGIGFLFYIARLK